MELRTVEELMDLLHACRGARTVPGRGGTAVDAHDHALRTAALLRRGRPADKELQVGRPGAARRPAAVAGRAGGTGRPCGGRGPGPARRAGRRSGGPPPPERPPRRRRPPHPARGGRGGPHRLFRRRGPGGLAHRAGAAGGAQLTAGGGGL
ncbi:LOW QUALITY PROTEIN: hypothetical protein SSFG_00750, partial [Streptomyces viridosporus ATCC 14672]